MDRRVLRLHKLYGQLRDRALWIRTACLDPRCKLVRKTMSTEKCGILRDVRTSVSTPVAASALVTLWTLRSWKIRCSKGPHGVTQFRDGTNWEEMENLALFFPSRSFFFCGGGLLDVSRPSAPVWMSVCRCVVQDASFRQVGRGRCFSDAMCGCRWRHLTRENNPGFHPKNSCVQDSLVGPSIGRLDGRLAGWLREGAGAPFFCDLFFQ